MSALLPSMGDDLRVIIIGASGGIGAALTERLLASPQVAQLYALSRQGVSLPSPKAQSLAFDFTDEKSVSAAAETLSETGKFDLIILATGLLQGQGISPEKNMKAMSLEAFQASFAANTFGPAITAKHFLPLLRRGRKTVLSALSARVGSISDNRLGGWYAYRASKAALNMILKTLAIEHGRRSKDTIILGLHPGTVDTTLSKPYQGNVAEGKLFTPEFCAEKLLTVIDSATPDYSGNLYDWAGKPIAF